MKLNHEKGSPPLYSQLKKILQECIEDGKYQTGSLMPTEKQLMETYGISRITVRQAFAELSQMGYICSQRGIGSRVIYEKIAEQLSGVVSLTDEMKSHHIIMQTSYCQMEKIHPTEKAAAALGITTEDTCYLLSRVRNVKGKPLVYTKTWLKNIADLPLEQKYYMESLYQYLREVHGICIEGGKDTMDAVSATPEVQSFLEISPDIPVFRRTRQTFIQNEEPFEYSICYYPGNRYQYTVNL